MITEDKNFNLLVSKLLLSLNKERDALMINGVIPPPPSLCYIKHVSSFLVYCFFLECHAVFVLCECLFCQLFSYYAYSNQSNYVCCIYCDYSALHGHRDWLTKYLVSCIVDLLPVPVMKLVKLPFQGT